MREAGEGTSLLDSADGLGKLPGERHRVKHSAEVERRRDEMRKTQAASHAQQCQWLQITQILLEDKLVTRDGQSPDYYFGEDRLLY